MSRCVRLIEQACNADGTFQPKLVDDVGATGTPLSIALTNGNLELLKLLLGIRSTSFKMSPIFDV